MKKSMLTKCLIALISMVFLLSCNSSRNREEVRIAVSILNESCPIDYNGFGHFTHFECDEESKTVKIDFKLNNDYIKVFWPHEAFTEEGLVVAVMVGGEPLFALDFLYQVFPLATTSNQYVQWISKNNRAATV